MGRWTAPGTALEIDAGGVVRYEVHDNQTDLVMTAPITRWSGDGFESTVGPVEVVFDIRTPPGIEDGTWYLTLGDRRLTRERMPSQTGAEPPTIGM